MAREMLTAAVCARVDLPCTNLVRPVFSLTRTCIVRNHIQIHQYTQTGHPRLTHSVTDTNPIRTSPSGHTRTEQQVRITPKYHAPRSHAHFMWFKGQYKGGVGWPRGARGLHCVQVQHKTGIFCVFCQNVHPIYNYGRCNTTHRKHSHTSISFPKPVLQSFRCSAQRCPNTGEGTAAPTSALERTIPFARQISSSPSRTAQHATTEYSGTARIKGLIQEMAFIQRIFILWEASAKRSFL